MVKKKATIDDVLEVIRPMKATVDSLVETVEFIKDKMVTKDELKEELDGVKTELNQIISSKIDGVHRRVDEEFDKRKVLDVRVTKLEARAH